MSYYTILRTQLAFDEGNKSFPYVDTKKKITIGIGRNLSDVGISQDEKDLMYAHDANRAVLAVVSLFPTFNSLSEMRKAVLCNMAFNMGREGLSEFHGLIAAVTKENWEDAVKSMLGSLWAKQTGDRAKRLANLMRAG